MSRAAVKRVAHRFTGRWMRGYAASKLRSDPAYAAVVESLHGRTAPLVDIGCGIGLLPFFLREHGYAAPIIGIDFDAAKIAQARLAARAYTEIDFVAGDARDPLPDGHDVVMLDVLQYFDRASQQRVLQSIATSMHPGNVFVMRQGLRDGSWRHRVTTFVDAIGRVVWNRSETLDFPSREELLAPFTGFEIETWPLWGRTPFNNHYFVIRRPV